MAGPVDGDGEPLLLLRGRRRFRAVLPEAVRTYNAKLGINGHEYLKRQLAKLGSGFEPLDNGILRCSDPAAMQRLPDGLTADKIDALLRKWLGAHSRFPGAVQCVGKDGL